jgi:uncharacterized protein YbgA (DUF1722 family)/uncharacterized protein YbbK (DUF523 family)
MSPPVRILVSACLLGEKVRYDGGHKRDPFLVETLGRYVEWVPVCPEVECGLPVPRDAMRLVGDPAAPRLVATKGGADHTGRMQAFIDRKLRALEDAGLCGYVCKKDSPSSGMERVKVYGGPSGLPSPTGRGLFTAAFMARFPLIPVEEEGRLRDPALREMFVERIFTLRRFRDLVAGGRTRGRLVAFHSDHKYLLLSHGRVHYEEMGRLVAQAKSMPAGELFGRYQEMLAKALATKATPRKCADVLHHMAGYFRPHLDADEKAELQSLITDYREGRAPLVVPVTLVRHYVRKYRVDYLARQHFLAPHPAELMLRNHA